MLIHTKPGAGTFSILEITGGLPGPINFAYAGLHRWDRAEGEDFDAFVRRAADAALEAGEMVMNVGGLPARRRIREVPDSGRLRRVVGDGRSVLPGSPRPRTGGLSAPLAGVAAIDRLH